MKLINLVCFVLLFILSISCKSGKGDTSVSSAPDSLPIILSDKHSDLIYSNMRHEASLKFAEHVLPHKPENLIQYKIELRKKIIEKAGIRIDHDIPLDMRETGSIQMKGYTIKNIVFQTRPGIFATANLFIPDGKGPFPGVINMLGHWRKGKIDSTGPQAVGHSLASSGYVCLTVDPWGAGERTTVHGDFEYHGGNLGASLMNIGESLLGIQVSDNMRGIDLLCSLPQVDPKKIGATGASGGGNQTMWLSAVDERVRASVPVVSVGSFESYIMRSNCICELLVDGFTFTEESGVLALANAPLMINHSKDDNPTFFPSEMLRSYANAKKAFLTAGVEDNISYRIFDLSHGYWTEDREAMLGWFDLHLKNEGTGEPRKEIQFNQLEEDKLMVFARGQRDKDVISTDQYCITKGNELREKFLNSGTIRTENKREELKEILRIGKKLNIEGVKKQPEKSGWELLIIETSEKLLLPVLHQPPSGKEMNYVIICNPGGKDSISLALIEEYRNSGTGIIIPDLFGTGEQASTASLTYDYNGRLHTLSRAELWMGRTILGEWVGEMDLLTRYLTSEMKATKVNIDGSKEAGLAALFFAATENKIENITLRVSPVSYLFDDRAKINFYGMGIHLPGILVWGDVSLAAALTGADVRFIDPRTISGAKPDEEKIKSFKEEYAKVRQLAGAKGRTEFN
ncbi:MAG TPA: acetylxylan esterase [Bacteroidales bacterium]|nr:acetylxylan esterase [Bacteroidales bacterium]